MGTPEDSWMDAELPLLFCPGPLSWGPQTTQSTCSARGQGLLRPTDTLHWPEPPSFSDNPSSLPLKAMYFVPLGPTHRCSVGQPCISVQKADTASGPRTTSLQGIPGASQVQSPHPRPGTSPALSLPSVCHSEGVCQASLVPREAEKLPLSSQAGPREPAHAEWLNPERGSWPTAPTNAAASSRRGVVHAC